MNRYPIHDTVSNFVSWTNDYGAMRQSRYLRNPLERTREGQDLLRHRVISDDNRINGFVDFYIERDAKDVGIFYLTAQPFNFVNPPSTELIEYFREMTAAIHERWPQNDLSLAAPGDPATWVRVLEEHGIAHGSIKWWEFIEQWTLEHWRRKGRRSLPITPTLEKFIGYKKTRIYEKTSLSEYAGD